MSEVEKASPAVPGIASGAGLQKLRGDLLISKKAGRLRHIGAMLGQSALFLVTSSSAIVVLFIFYFIIRDAIPFFQLEGIKEFFTSARWYPSASPGEYGTLAIFIGSGLVTLGAIALAMPMGIAAAVCLSDILPFSIRQTIKPIIEVLAAIPSVAFGFFALVVFAPLLQESGGRILAVITWLLGLPAGGLLVIVLADLITGRIREDRRNGARAVLFVCFGGAVIGLLTLISSRLNDVEISSGTNALNVSIILGIMAMPTIVSVSEDALQAVGRELREGSYALGATRAETILKVVIPAAGSGIIAAVILGIMRVIGETMVVWMASGNAAQIPEPWYNILEPVRTLTATIAGDMGEADQVMGSARYHVLFAMAFILLAFSFLSNLASEWIVLRSRRKVGG